MLASIAWVRVNINSIIKISDQKIHTIPIRNVETGTCTMLRFEVKVAVFQMLQKLTKMISICSFHLNWMYFVQKWSVFYRKVWNLSQIHDHLFYFGYLCQFTNERICVFSLFLLLCEIRRVLSGKMGISAL